MTKPSNPPNPEDHWFAHQPEGPEPQHEQVISETRGIQEALAQLGPGATVEQVRDLLAQRGMIVSPALVAKVRADAGLAG